MNSGLLKEEQLKRSIIKCIKEEEGSCLFDEDVCVWWEKVKGKIKKKSISYAKQQSFMRKKKEKELKEKLDIELQKIENKADHDKVNYMQIQAEIDNFERENVPELL